MYERVFSPIRIGTVETPTRIMRTAHATSFSRSQVNDDLIAHHMERAKGGAGLSIVESTSVHPSPTFSLSARDDDAFAPMRRLVQPVGHHFVGAMHCRCATFTPRSAKATWLGVRSPENLPSPSHRKDRSWPGTHSPRYAFLMSGSCRNTSDGPCLTTVPDSST